MSKDKKIFKDKKVLNLGKVWRKRGLVRYSFIARLILIMCLVLAISMFWFPIQEVEAAGWLTGYTTRRRLTIDQLQVDADLTNFPVLVKLTSANFDFAKTTATGFDIRFTSSDGTTLLAYERERHDKVGSRAEYWVRVPAVSGTVDTVIYIYYRNDTGIADGANPTAVWDTNFRASWRLREAGTGAVGEYRDSTVNANHGRGGSGVATRVPDRVESKIGMGQNFIRVSDTMGDFIDVPHSASVDLTTLWTLEAWVRRSAIGVQHGVIEKYNWASGRGAFGFRIGSNNRLLVFIVNGTSIQNVEPVAILSSGIWYYVVATFDAGTDRL